jgi:hypothetical protein
VRELDRWLERKHLYSACCEEYAESDGRST